MAVPTRLLPDGPLRLLPLARRRNDSAKLKYTDEGKRTEYLEGVLKFLQEYQVQHQRTRAFVQSLDKLELLESMQANVALKSGEKHSLSGFQVVSRDKLNGLSSALIHDLFKRGALALVYAHLQSLANFGAMVDRLAGHGSA